MPVNSPRYHLGMDLVGLVSRHSQGGNQNIIRVSDYFTKFVPAKVLSSREAVPVVSSLREVSIVIKEYM